MKINQIMTANPACCTMDTGVQQIAKMMVANDCGCIPVLESMANPKLVGMVTDRDVMCRAVASGRDQSQMTAKDCMSAPVITATPEDDVEDCCRKMEEHQVRRIPVVDEDGACRGIVAQADVARSCSKEQAGELVREVSQATWTPSHVTI